MYYIVFIGFIIVGIMLFNNIVKYKKKVEQAKSGIDIYLTQRFDLIPNLLTCVKEYCEYESKLVTEITQLRSEYMNNKNNLNIKNELSTNLNHVLLTAEEYPELKASEQFLNLQKNLSKMENQLQAARRIYNIEATAYNTKISSVPFNIIAKIFNFKEEKLFKLEQNKEEVNE